MVNFFLKLILKKETKRVVDFFLVSVILGFLLGVKFSLRKILPNGYFQYRMWQIALWILERNLNKWIFGSGVCSLLIFYLWKLFPKTVNEFLCEDRIVRFFFNMNWERVLVLVRKIGVFLLVFLGILNLSVFIKGKIITSNKPNVILIGIDTLRADHLSCYGYKRKTTPFIDEFAKESVVFENAFSTTSWTLPSFMSILTGLYLSSHKVVTPENKLHSSFITLAEIFKNQGYKTAGFVSAPFLKKNFGFVQGFDVYNEATSSPTHIESHKDITSPQITKLVLNWLHKNKNKRFFLFIHYWDPHYDYIPPPPYDKIFDPYYTGTIDGTDIENSKKIHPGMDERDLQHIIALYDGEIRWTDFHIGKLFSELKRLNLYKNTLIIIVADHGEEFLEHNGKGHRRTLYNEVIHVPLILKLPYSSKNKYVKSPVSTIDILPTILEVLNITPPVEIEGKSLLLYIHADKENFDREIYSELYEERKEKIALIYYPYKLIYNISFKKFEMYNIQKDAFEKKNLINVFPQIANRLRGKLFDWYKSRIFNTSKTSKTKLDEETLQQLKSLGYLH